MFKTLRVKLLVFFLLTTLTPLSFLGYISYQSQKQELTKYIEQSLLTFSNELASEIERTLYERISDVKHLATNPILKEVSSTNEEIQEQFIHFMDVYDFYSDTIFVKPDGIVSISSIDKVIGSDLNDRKWFQASIKGDIYLSDIYLSPVIHEPVLVMSAPVFNESGEEVVGVISPLFDLNYLWQTFTKFSEQDQIVGLEGYAFLINKNGEFIAHPDHRKILNENHLEKNNLNGSEIVFNSKN
ncbi:cache domain-containing protein [Anaerobacillus isosaccharinicus]|uniref:Cache domain-containing protein n=1 Tax=Anaerobacillus isosaccharinicus TaxID=1532552 RepID=A0A1S2KY97_9BACI|nr:cache domain-containing protein [Anaerobacillus isosaccharinicus]MBA5584302.1 cache domain-containing protein [Anaerobacillus isosaccharinicus]QOY37298.1 cache domain-containing protein [Anaerobacillus isosaccharinicus]